MNLNMEATRSPRWVRAERDKGKGELIANAIIKNGDSLERCNNCNYDPAALSSPTSVFEVGWRGKGEDVYGRA